MALSRQILALCLALGVAACGGHHSPTGPTPPPDDGDGGSTTPPPPPPTLAVSRILAFGDSMTAGTTQPPVTLWSTLGVTIPAPTDAGRSTSYPYKLQALDDARYTSQTITVLNGGYAGRRASEDRDRLSTYVDDLSPDVVLLLEGANDLNHSGLSDEEVDELVTATVNAMEGMVRDTVRKGVPVLLATLPPQRASGHNGRGAAYVRQYNQALKVMAAKKGAFIVDLYTKIPLDLIGQDGLHPTEAGYDRMAEIFQQAIADRWEQ